MEECTNPLQVKASMIAEVYSTSTGRLLMAYMSLKELDKLISSIDLPKKNSGLELRHGGLLRLTLSQAPNFRFTYLLTA